MISIKGGIGRIAMFVATAVAGLTAERFGLAAPIMLRAALPVVSLVIYGVTQCCCPLATAANGR